MEVLCAPTSAAPAMRVSTSSGKRTPSFSATACASSIMVRGTRRASPGSAVITSSVARVSAQIRLKDRFPQSLTQMSSRMLRPHRRLEAGRLIISCEDAMRALALQPSGSPRSKRLRVGVLDDAGRRRTSAAG